MMENKKQCPECGGEIIDRKCTKCSYKELPESTENASSEKKDGVKKTEGNDSHNNRNGQNRQKKNNNNKKRRPQGAYAANGAKGSDNRPKNTDGGNTSVKAVESADNKTPKDNAPKSDNKSGAAENKPQGDSAPKSENKIRQSDKKAPKDGGRTSDYKYKSSDNKQAKDAEKPSDSKPSEKKSGKNDTAADFDAENREKVRAAAREREKPSEEALSVYESEMPVATNGHSDLVEIILYPVPENDILYCILLSLIPFLGIVVGATLFKASYKPIHIAAAFLCLIMGALYIFLPVLVPSLMFYKMLPNFWE